MFPRLERYVVLNNESVTTVYPVVVVSVAGSCGWADERTINSPLPPFLSNDPLNNDGIINYPINC
jgi:hypothetical protein